MSPVWLSLGLFAVFKEAQELAARRVKGPLVFGPVAENERSTFLIEGGEYDVFDRLLPELGVPVQA